MLNIFDFEDDIAYIIAVRGQDYFESGNVLSLWKVDECYVASVRGTSNYTVTVELDDEGDVLASRCTCPYDGGPVCKHEAAVYYALQEKLSKEQGSDSDTDLRELLVDQSKEALVDFLLRLASQSPELRYRLGIEFGKKESAGVECLSDAKNLVRSYINRHSDRDGYIRWDELDEAVVGARMVLEMATDAIGAEEFQKALDLVFCVTQELVSALEFTDDSEGVIVLELEEALGLMEVIASQADMEKGWDMFNQLLQESKNNDYESDWILRILEACAEFVDSEERRDMLNSRLEALGAGDEYTGRRVTVIRHCMIEHLDGEEAAAQFALDHVVLPEFRELIIRDFLQKGQFEQAVALALDGEEQDKQDLGLVCLWQKLRYDAYETSGQVDKQRGLARELILAGEYDFFLKLRSTFLPTEWTEVYPDLLREMKERLTGYRNSVYCKALVEEKAFGLLLEHVQENPRSILEYLDLLLADHEEEAFAVFRDFISSEAESANSRRMYQGVCGLIRKFAKAAGRERASEVVQGLRLRYKQRRALQEELKYLLSELK